MIEKAARDFADKTTAYTKDALEKSKTAAAETTRVVEQSYKTASEGAVEFNLQFIEIAQSELERGLRLGASAIPRQIAERILRIVDNARA